MSEITVTLQDVNVLFRLVIDRHVMIGWADYNVKSYCIQYLGRQPPSSTIYSHRLTLQWLGLEFNLTILSPHTLSCR